MDTNITTRINIQHAPAYYRALVRLAIARDAAEVAANAAERIDFNSPAHDGYVNLYSAVMANMGVAAKLVTAVENANKAFAKAADAYELFYGCEADMAAIEYDLANIPVPVK